MSQFQRVRLLRSCRRLGLPLVAVLTASVIGCAATENGAPEPEDNPQQVDLDREIEEADIVKEVDGLFYIANPYRGLRIIDARDMASPQLVGGLSVAGRGVELYVRDNQVYLFTAADFVRCAGQPVGFRQAEFAGVIQPDYSGSRLWIIDVTDPATPVEVKRVDFAGFVDASRRVDDALYAAGKVYDPATEFSSTSGGSSATSQPASLPPTVFVTSINIADPANAAVVETETFTGSSASFFSSFSLDVFVSDTAIYVLDPSETSQTTLVSYLDIRDPAGQIVPRAQFRVPGVVRNRFFADEFQSTFRIVTEERAAPNFSTAVRLYTFGVQNPDAIVRLAELPIIGNESLRSVRFDGERGYAVTFLQVDPLFVLDLADPAAPRVAGELEVPGFSTHLVPLGTRLVGVGFDNTNGVRPAVALYDVSDPATPRQLDRVILGQAGSYDAFSEATVDEKALKVLEDAGLILMPFSFYDSLSLHYVDSLQLIGLSDAALTERGRIDHNGLVRRAGLKDGHVWVLSDLAFQTLDATDLDAPQSFKSVSIIDEQELLDAGLSNCADSARWRGTDLGIGFGPWFPGPCAFLGLGGLLFAVLALVRVSRRK